MKKKGRKVLPQSTLSIKKLELEVNKLNKSLDSIDSKYDTIFDSLVLTFRDFKDNYSISNNLNLDQRVLEIESFIEEYKIEKEIEIDKKAEENENQSNLTDFFHYLSSYLVVILVSFLITFLFFTFHFKLVSYSLNFKLQNTQTNLQ